MGTLAAPGARRSEKKSSLHLYRHTGLLDRFGFFASVFTNASFRSLARRAVAPVVPVFTAQHAK